VIANINPETGIRYGVVALDTLADWVFDEFFYNGKNETADAAFEEWKQENFTPKLKVITLERFDNLAFAYNLEEELKGYDAFICTIGSRWKHGKEMFTKVDKTFPLEFARLAEKVGVKYLSIITAHHSDRDSNFMYYKVKGELEDEILQFKIPFLSIFRPGLIIEREREKDWRPQEKIG